ncbi:formylglycine-generating enzyme family protein [Leptospira sp. GIMC2001]|uniref:formylglycine-generating enzyme family protein n=1 Tax=Leptospira sp. GIMC2001 TaxID=1513297 RepID=UPI00234BA41A|nr:SUMF1/EgtB/PvdO family nonheme iron enzyme [Leptospira sp. GIMC2001]WCL49809.1 SUMF1/EgtB/PvdO family nonheme iron enzyme [Leptospira sp. GIMC2001]
MFKFCARFIVFIYLLVFFPELGNISSQENATSEVDLAVRKTLVWKGEIRGIYERRSQLKIQISRNQELPQNFPDQDTMKKEILSKTWIIYQKDTKRELADFTPREVIWEKKQNKIAKKSYDAVIWGDITVRDQVSLSLITAGCFIAQYKDVVSFLEPHNFFSKKPTPPQSFILHPKDGKQMVLVDRGVFLYGQGTDASEASFNPHFFDPNLGNLKEIQPFYIDKYEVTNEEYSIFLKQTNTSPPQHWRDGKYPESERDHPVNFLTYREVEAYAKWAGKRLPTEFEWEKAARGSGIEIYQNRDETLAYYIQAKTYPFGDQFDRNLCNSLESGKNQTINVYDLPSTSASPFGAIGMCGNVAEWTSSWLDSYPKQPYNLKGYGKMFKVIRGGSYLEDRLISRSYHRSYGGHPNLAEDRKAGMRLVTDYRP